MESFSEMQGVISLSDGMYSFLEDREQNKSDILLVKISITEKLPGPEAGWIGCAIFELLQY